MGKAHLANKEGDKPTHLKALGWKLIGTGDYERMEGQGPKIGWAFDSYVYLNLQAALAVVKTFSTQTGNHLGSTERAIAKALKEAGKLGRSGARAKVKVTIEGTRKHLLCLPLSLIVEEDETEQKSPF